MVTTRARSVFPSLNPNFHFFRLSSNATYNPAFFALSSLRAAWFFSFIVPPIGLVFKWRSFTKQPCLLRTTYIGSTTIRSPAAPFLHTKVRLLRLFAYRLRRGAPPMKSSNTESTPVFATATSVSDSSAWFISLARQIRAILKDHLNPNRVPITAAPIEMKEIWSRRENHIPGLL